MVEFELAALHGYAASKSGLGTSVWVSVPQEVRTMHGFAKHLRGKLPQLTIKERIVFLEGQGQIAMTMDTGALKDNAHITVREEGEYLQECDAAAGISTSIPGVESAKVLGPAQLQNAGSLKDTTASEGKELEAQREQGVYKGSELPSGAGPTTELPSSVGNTTPEEGNTKPKPEELQEQQLPEVTLPHRPPRHELVRRLAAGPDQVKKELLKKYDAGTLNPYLLGYDKKPLPALYPQQGVRYCKLDGKFEEVVCCTVCKVPRFTWDFSRTMLERKKPYAKICLECEDTLQCADCGDFCRPHHFSSNPTRRARTTMMTTTRVKVGVTTTTEPTTVRVTMPVGMVVMVMVMMATAVMARTMRMAVTTMMGVMVTSTMVLVTTMMATSGPAWLEKELQGRALAQSKGALLLRGRLLWKTRSLATQSLTGCRMRTQRLCRRGSCVRSNFG